MIRRPRALHHSKILLSAVLLACACLSAAAASAVAAEAVVTYTDESLPAYAQQLASGQIQAATFNKKVRSLHLTLKDGRHVLVKYAPHEEPKLAAQLQVKHVPVTFEVPPGAAKSTTAKPVHHKLRYIAGGILLAVIIVVGVVLLVDRQRKRAETAPSG